MIGVAMLTVLATLGIPQVDRSLSAYRLESSGQKLASELNLARGLAMSRNHSYEISFDAEGHGYQVVDPDDSTTPPRATQFLDDGCSFQSLPGNPIQFFSRGHARSGTVVLENTYGHRITVNVLASGLVQVSRN